MEKQDQLSSAGAVYKLVYLLVNTTLEEKTLIYKVTSVPLPASARTSTFQASPRPPAAAKRMRRAVPAAAPFSGRLRSSAAPPRRLPVTRLGAGNGKPEGARPVQFAMGLFGKTQEKPPKELVRAPAAAADERVGLRGTE